MCIKLSPTGVFASDKMVVLFVLCVSSSWDFCGKCDGIWGAGLVTPSVTANILVNYKFYGNTMHAYAWNQTSQQLSVDIKHKQHYKHPTTCLSFTVYSVCQHLIASSVSCFLVFTTYYIHDHFPVWIQ